MKKRPNGAPKGARGAAYIQVSKDEQDKRSQVKKVEDWLKSRGIDPGTLEWIVDRGSRHDRQGRHRLQPDRQELHARAGLGHFVLPSSTPPGQVEPSLAATGLRLPRETRGAAAAAFGLVVAPRTPPRCLPCDGNAVPRRARLRHGQLGRVRAGRQHFHPCFLLPGTKLTARQQHLAVQARSASAASVS
jgi:hypothetical protein